MNSKLVLFDIDGTLVSHLPHWNWEAQYVYGMSKAFGYTDTFRAKDYNGTAERYMPWDLVKGVGVSRKDYLRKFPEYVDAMYEHIQKQVQKHGQSFERIPTAASLVEKLYIQKKVYLGVLTGNAKKIARWKLDHTGLARYFPFGLYGDEADDRIELAGQVFERAKKELGLILKPSDIIVVGDTVYDIRCGKAIGAYTIAVTTGMHSDRTVLSQENPDLLVDSLLDKSVLALFSLK
jgi:phosphoglycolate phosphatase